MIDASTLFRKGCTELPRARARRADRRWARRSRTWTTAKVVGLDEIESEDWTLNISRYVLPPIGNEIRRFRRQPLHSPGGRRGGAPPRTGCARRFEGGWLS